MFSSLINHNPDIRRLVEKGYAVSTDSNYLVVRDIPYLDNNRELQIGAIVTKMEAVDQFRVKQQDHQIFFCGSHPCELSGEPIRNLGGGTVTLRLASTDLNVQRSFSNKPAEGFADFYEKIESYVNLFCGPAIALHGANPLTFRSVEDEGESVFNFRDTMTSRAEIGDLAANFEQDVVAVIGLGGTGSYLLDFLVKTPVREIRAFDADYFHVHNAYRSPGKLDASELGLKKSQVYQSRYGEFHLGLKCYPSNVVTGSEMDLEGISFAFICVDKGSARAEIADMLIKMNIPFIDVGMGLDRSTGSISGTIRTTFFNKDVNQELLDKRVVPLTDIPDGIYQNNIQISELNALNASLAIIKYKQFRGFYYDDNGCSHILYDFNSFQSFRNNG